MSDSTSNELMLTRIVRVITEAAQPERIILFGSRARGAAREDSDYDLLVIVRGAPNERQISRRIYRALLAHEVNAAVDVIVVQAEKLEQHRDSPYYVYRQALREGEIAYEQN